MRFRIWLGDKVLYFFRQGRVTLRLPTHFVPCDKALPFFSLHHCRSSPVPFLYEHLTDTNHISHRALQRAYCTLEGYWTTAPRRISVLTAKGKRRRLLKKMPPAREFINGTAREVVPFVRPAHGFSLLKLQPLPADSRCPAWQQIAVPQPDGNYTPVKVIDLVTILNRITLTSRELREQYWDLIGRSSYP